LDNATRQHIFENPNIFAREDSRNSNSKEISPKNKAI
jgi:hypothetical protein